MICTSSCKILVLGFALTLAGGSLCGEGMSKFEAESYDRKRLEDRGASENELENLRRLYHGTTEHDRWNDDRNYVRELYKKDGASQKTLNALDNYYYFVETDAKPSNLSKKTKSKRAFNRACLSGSKGFSDSSASVNGKKVVNRNSLQDQWARDKQRGKKIQDDLEREKKLQNRNSRKCQNLQRNQRNKQTNFGKLYSKKKNSKAKKRHNKRNKTGSDGWTLVVK
jgi:hypothetical protein